MNGSNSRRVRTVPAVMVITHMVASYIHNAYTHTHTHTYTHINTSIRAYVLAMNAYMRV